MKGGGIIMASRSGGGFGAKDGSRRGMKAGGMRRNRTAVCRHPAIKSARRAK